MIARIWHGRTRTSDADAYMAFLRERAIWESADAIRAFAGDDIARAKYYPEDTGFLLEFEPTVQHYELESATP